MPTISVSSIVPSVNLPDLGKFTLPGGAKLDLRFLDNSAEKAINTTSEVVIATALALMVIGVGWMISTKIATYTQRGLMNLKAETTFAAFVGSLARYTLFFTCVVLALSLLGMSHATTVTLVGATGLATAFALRGTVSHLASGVMIMANRPFKVGDYIELRDGAEKPQGTVKRITLFNTEINTPTHERLFIPNSKVWENIVLNHTYNDIRMITLTIPVAPEASLRVIKKAVTPILQAEKTILRRIEPAIGFEGFDEKFTALKLVINVWVRARDFDTMHITLMAPVLEALHQAKVPILVVGKREK